MCVICHYHCCYLTLSFSAMTESSVLDGSKSYLLEDPFLDSIGLQLHVVYKVLICIACKAAKKPCDLKGHLKKHQLDLTKSQQSELESICKRLGVNPGSDVALPAPNGPPVEGLKLIKGYCCTHCSYCAPEKRTIQTHWSRAHRGIVAFDNGRFTQGSLQSFFDPIPLKYFQVNPDLEGVATNDPYTVYARDEKPRYQQLPGNPPTAPREVPPLLTATGWHVHLDVYCRDSTLRRSLKTLTKLPRQPTTTGIDSLGSIVYAYQQSIRTLANKVPFGVRCWLMQCPRYVNFSSCCIHCIHCIP
jgi:Orsellinic acid/F9775 biosynthesis cluster protein D